MAARYQLRTAAPVKLDRDALVRGLMLLPLDTWRGRWQASLQAMAVVQRSASDPDGWLWGYGVWMALSGRELPVSIGTSDVISEGYAAGRDLVQVGTLVLEPPLGAKRSLSSGSPGRDWWN